MTSCLSLCSLVPWCMVEVVQILSIIVTFSVAQFYVLQIALPVQCPARVKSSGLVAVVVWKPGP